MTPIQKALAVVQSEDKFAEARARAMMLVYHEVWRNQWPEFEIVKVEPEFKFPLINPETGGQSQTFEEGGKIDVLARRRSTGVLVVIEHKTTADEVDPDSNYWDRLRMDTQVSKYFLAGAHIDTDIQGVMYDVARKPGQRPSGIPLLDADGIKIVLDANGTRVMTKQGKWRQTGEAELGYVLQTRPETPLEFENRLLDVMRENPARYFAQREVPRLDKDILEYMSDAWALGQQLIYFRNRNIWPRNPDACDQFGVCSMWDLCAGRASVDGIRYKIRENTHPELKIQGDEKRGLLTTSRSRAFKKCAHLHKLLYEDRVERVETETDSPLKFGTLMHSAWEAYFNALKEQQ